MTAEQNERIAQTRDEDDRLLTGRGRYTADIALEGMVHLAVVRSPYAHGRLNGLECEGAREAPGVMGVFTAEDLAADGIEVFAPNVRLKRPDGSDPPSAGRPILARDRVLYVGEAIAFVVAASPEQAADAAELVVPDIEELPAQPTLEEATAKDAAAVWQGASDNVAFVWKKQDGAAIEKAFAEAKHVVRGSFRISRVHASPMEPRAALGVADGDGRLRLYLSHQAPFQVRDELAKQVFKVDPQKIKVIAPDVGGSFGMKLGVHPEDVMVLWAARKLGRPVRWVCGRSEAFLADDHGRDVRIEAALALDGALNFLALDVLYEMNAGAYLSGRSQVAVGNIGGIAGVYRLPVIGAEVRCILSHSVPVGPYRGAGRPEATLAIERLIDLAAREVGVEPYELRYRNLIPSDAMPYATALTFIYDCGDFARNMEAAAEKADLAGFPLRRSEAAAAGKLRGIGIANCIEVAGGPFGNIRPEFARVVVEADGGVILASGAMSTGQGLETALPNLLANAFGIERARVRFRQGDTDALSSGRGSGGSSALVVGGPAVGDAAAKVIEKGRAVTAHHFEAATADIEFARGRFTVAGTDRSLDLAEVARLASDPEALPEGMEPGLDESAEFAPEIVTYPNGCHICEVEVDRETGKVQVVSYVAVEDVGTVLFPAFVEGQMQGGIAQGIGQAIAEAIVYEAASGQLVTGTFNDYAMPIAADLPSITVLTQPVPTAANPLGAKGVGEAGTVGSLSASLNAVCDALAPLGVTHLDMPASPLRVWEAIQQAEAGS